MKLFVTIGLYALLNAYVLLRTALFVRNNLPGRRGRALSGVVAVFHAAFALTPPIAFFLPNGSLRGMLQRVANGFEGLFIQLLFAYVLLEIVCLIVRLLKKTRGFVQKRGPVKLLLGAAVWGICLCMCVYGTIHASDLKVKHFDVSVHKPCKALDTLRVVLIADTHLGYSVGAKRMEDMVEKVNAQNADLIVFAGDVFDNAADTMDDPEAVKAALSRLSSRLGVYACWGNHDVSGQLFSGFSMTPNDQALRTTQMQAFLENCGIRVLADEAVWVGDAFWLIGRKDYSHSGDGTSNRATLGELMAAVTPDHPILVIDHQPRFLQENADAGVDVLLSGHTHNGQLFPLNLGIGLIWENPGGLLQKGTMTSIVTGGVGVYGPDMRIGTDAEITVVHLTFSQ